MTETIKNPEGQFSSNPRQGGGQWIRQDNISGKSLTADCNEKGDCVTVSIFLPGSDTKREFFIINAEDFKQWAKEVLKHLE